jgi:hypothetical protein
MPASAAPALRPARARPGALRPWACERRFERRIGRRLAGGLTPAQAATAEGVPEGDVATLLADPAFTTLVDAYRHLQALPEAAARERLRRLARALLDEALVEGDVRVACFILREEGRGRDPADTLARGVLVTAAATPSPAPPTPEPARPRSRDRRDPANRAAWRAAEGLRDAVLAEHVVVHKATAVPASAPTARAPAPAAPNRCQRRLRPVALHRREPAARARAGGQGGRDPP